MNDVEKKFFAFVCCSFVIYLFIHGAETKWSIGDPCCTKCGDNHTMCRFKELKYGERCIRPTLIQIDNSLMKKIVHTLNFKRNDLGRKLKATALHYVKWNHELQNLANRWAAQCIPERDLCRDRVDSLVGQLVQRKLSVSLDPSNEILSTIKSWFYLSNRQLIRGSGRRYFWVTDSEYFNQVMLHETKEVGCSALFNIHSQSGQRNLHIVCNFVPAILKVDTYLFRTGMPTCSECPPGTKCSSNVFPVLCLGSERTSYNLRILTAFLIWACF
ncbi:venom allergen 5-like [Cimex lectularius]|uniref:SCP domain-containing protein n=1 Tax=Cimex lectularius TaxID=79782 RepID=A0A8I6THP5_CIMLE|nr:venom allergen 5-like [Cimex lectularius]